MESHNFIAIYYYYASQNQPHNADKPVCKASPQMQDCAMNCSGLYSTSKIFCSFLKCNGLVTDNKDLIFFYHHAPSYKYWICKPMDCIVIECLIKKKSLWDTRWSRWREWDCGLFSLTRDICITLLQRLRRQCEKRVGRLSEAVYDSEERVLFRHSRTVAHNEPTKTVTACTRLVQAQPDQMRTWIGEVAPSPSLAKELSSTESCWERDGRCSLKMWLLVYQLWSSGCSNTRENMGRTNWTQWV